MASPATLIIIMVVASSFGNGLCSAQTPSGRSSPSPTRVPGPVSAERPPVPPGQSSRELRAAAIASLPATRLTPEAKLRINNIVEKPTLFRHLPTQAVDCDPELFLYIARHPEVLVGIWDVMGVTQVHCERLDEYRLKARDGSGTTCTVDLVYGDRSTHVYVADGFYDGKLVAAPLTGKGVFVLRTRFETRADGLTTVYGSLDCFVQLDNIGADLIARTFGPLIGRTADNNFAETARFIGQIGSTARTNPQGLEELASGLPQVSEKTRRGFVEVIRDVDQRNLARLEKEAMAHSAELPSDSLPLR
jgi:hypothetical protein